MKKLQPTGPCSTGWEQPQQRVFSRHPGTSRGVRRVACIALTAAATQVSIAVPENLKLDPETDRKPVTRESTTGVIQRPQSRDRSTPKYGGLE